MKSNFLKRALSVGLCATLVVSAAAISAYAADETVTGDGEYVYGTVNLPYADFYYGELNDVEENSELQLDAEDKAAALREEGVLDAVSSATTSKWQSYTSTYFAKHETDDGGSIYGIADASVAIPTSLYNALKDVAEGTESKNSVLEIFSNFKVNENQSTPAEYKVLNGDGTLTATVDSADKVVIDGTSLALQNNTKYGHYEFDCDDENLPAKEDVEGVVLEAKDDDGKVTKYAALHLDNVWFKTGHISFCVKDGFVSHGNNILYKQFVDIVGKTITKVTYIVRGGADVVLNTNLFCKTLLEKEQGFTAKDSALYADGAKVEFASNVPEDSNYAVSSVTYDKRALTEGVDYSYENNTLTVKDTENTGVGTYTLTYSDDKYIDATATATFNSSLEASQIKFSDNKIVIDESAGVAVSDYVKNITAISVDGAALASVDGVINADGSVNFDASYTRKGATTVFFPENKEYEITVTSAGYPEVSGQVTKTEQSATETTEPTTESVEPTTASTEPATEVTHPTSETVKPTTEATEPTTAKTTTQKSANTVKVTVKKATNKVKVAKVKRAKVTIKNVIKVTKAKGTVSYSKASGSKALKVTKKGYITVAKGTKKGTYTIKIKVTAKGTSKYNKKTVTTKKIKVKVVK